MIRIANRLALAAALAVMLLAVPLRAWAGPVSWQEVPPTAEGRQWWDEGSLRRNRSGHLTVLSRFQAAAPSDAAESGSVAPSMAPSPAPSTAASSLSASATGPAASGPEGALPAASGPSSLYVMELDCDQSLYRDISINGLPRFGAVWQPTGSDDLTAEVLRQACAAEAR